jgi:hypothetical protein
LLTGPELTPNWPGIGPELRSGHRGISPDGGRPSLALQEAPDQLVVLVPPALHAAWALASRAFTLDSRFWTQVIRLAMASARLV